MRRLLGLGMLAGGAAFRSVRGRFGKPAVDRNPPSFDREPPRRPSLLVVAPYPVHPPIHGGAVRIFNLVRRLADHMDVSLFLFGGGTDDPPQRAVFEPFCRRVFIQRFPLPDPRSDPWGRLPPLAARYASPVVADRIAAIVAAHHVDVVLLESTELASYTGPFPNASVIIDEHDLSFRSHARQRAVGISRFDTLNVLGGGYADWVRRYHFELEACETVDQVHVMSTTDSTVLSRHLRDGTRRIRVIPNGVDTDHFRAPADNAHRRGVLFVGSFPHLPNLDALHHLADEIWPLVREALPDAELTVAGARPPESVLALNGKNGIHVVGEVADMAPLYQRHKVLAVPIRAGSGTRLKILEAMACGLPVVSTALGAEGIECRPGHDLAVAERPDGMAAAIGDLVGRDEARWRALSEGGRQLVVERYDWDRIAVRLRHAVAELVSGPTPGLSIHGEQPGASGHPVQASVIVIVRRGGSALERCLDGVAGQTTDRTFEIVAVDLGVSDTYRRLLLERGVRLIRCRRSSVGCGEAANLGAEAALGRVLVFLGEDVVPADPGWLDRLLVPFDSPDAPAAVQGGVTAQFVAGAPPHDPRFTREAARWRTDHGGFELSMVNVAVRRNVWESFPFTPNTAMSGLRWQRQAAANELLVLPCWAAAVVWVRRRDAGDVLRECVVDGREWRALGVRYGLGDLLADLRRPLPYLDGQGGRVPTPPELGTGTERHFGRLRPIALFVGSTFPWAVRKIED